MPFSPPPLLSIEVDTPPDSPTESFVDLELTPLQAKRPRAGSPSAETPTKRNRQFTGPITRSFQHSRTPPTNQQPAVSSDLLDRLPSVDPGLVEGDTKDTYLQYVDLVLAEGIAIYQISHTIFVVQGWDSRSVSGTVSNHFTSKHVTDHKTEALVPPSMQADWRRICIRVLLPRS